MIVAKSEKQNPAFGQRLCGVVAITNDQNSPNKVLNNNVLRSRIE
jgi:hypothetical protein